MDNVTTYLAHLYGAFMEARPEARPILRRLFFMTATHDWATDVPAGTLDAAAPSMTAMHHAIERQDCAEALVQLRVWAGLLGVTGGEGTA
jgi:hypothetical protein